MLDNIWNKKEKLTLKTISIFWLSATLIFFIWWFRKEHIGTLFGFISTSFVLAWVFFLQFYYFFFLRRMKNLSIDHHEPINGKVAMVVTKAPSEPFEIVKITLLAMLSQEYPHDTWVADENPSHEALEWYKANGVYVSCRKDDLLYHNDKWPRRKKCKEGNLAYFYDKYGYELYDFVVHMDVDHVPAVDYLKHMIRPFYDPKIGYVAAPSICDNNASQSWAARARSDSESVFHGPIQAGTNDRWVPLCIGSHYAVRTEALKQIGGIGPELAEDYSTTLLMNSYGWKGMWTYNAEAHGDGPQSFTDVIIQDYQWARSLVTLLFSFYFKFFQRLSWRQKFEFTVTQLWYPVTAIVWLISIVIPWVVLLTFKVPVKVNIFTFLLLAGVPYALSALSFLYVRKKGYLRPKNVNFFSWENALFEMARWPWVILGCLDAIFSLIIKRKIQFRVTPKDKSNLQGLSFKIISPYIFITFFSAALLFLKGKKADLSGYYWFVFIQMISYTSLILAVIGLHFYENKPLIKSGKDVKASNNWGILFISSIPVLFILYSFIFPINFLHEGNVRAMIQPVVLKDDTHTEDLYKTEISYIVKPGDTLWAISKVFYGDSSKWRKILDANISKIKIYQNDLIVIHPGTVLVIPN